MKKKKKEEKNDYISRPVRKYNGSLCTYLRERDEEVIKNISLWIFQGSKKKLNWEILPGSIPIRSNLKLIHPKVKINLIFLDGRVVKNPLPIQEMQVQFLGQEGPREKEMATHFSILAWEIPWTEETGWLQSMGWQRVRHDLATKQQQT